MNKLIKISELEPYEGSFRDAEVMATDRRTNESKRLNLGAIEDAREAAALATGSSESADSSKAAIEKDYHKGVSGSGTIDNPAPGTVRERANADHSRADQDHATAVADDTRAGEDHARAEQDHTRAEGDHSSAVTDHNTAGSDHSTAGTDSTRAGEDHARAEQDHTRAEGDHTTAGTDHTTAGTDHTRAGEDHARAEQDHTRAEGDHSTAVTDHSTAGSDHTRAEGDHTTATTDHTTAGSDHTRAEGDHTTATTDHSTAGTDHNRAEADHTRAEADHTAAETAAAYVARENMEVLLRDNAVYDEYAAIAGASLRVRSAGSVVRSDAVVASKSGYCITEPVEVLRGHRYLIPTSAIAASDAGVALVAKYATKEQQVSVAYTYYAGTGASGAVVLVDNDGIPVDENAVVLSCKDDAGVVYNAALEESEGEQRINHWVRVSDGASLDYLPLTRTVTAGSFVPKFNKVDSVAPVKGYYAFLCLENCQVSFSLKQSCLSDAGFSILHRVYGIDLSHANQYAQNASVKALEERVVKLEAFHTYDTDFCVGEWAEELASPDAVQVLGSREFAQDWHVFLLDVTAPQNEDGTVTPVGELQRGNGLRFLDGRFAPVVGITAEQAAECEVDLYLDAEGSQLYCQAGEFDAEAFYTEHGMAPLYNGEGQQVRVLRPWETTETKYTIGICRTSAVYVLDGQRGLSGKCWKGIFGRPGYWDGIDLTPYRLDPTLMQMNICTEVNSSPRAFFFDCDKGVKGTNGEGGLITWWGPSSGKTYPKSAIGAQTIMQHARALNADNTKSYPFAEGGFHAYNAYIISQEVAYGTNYLHDAARFGSGISNNDSCNSEATFYRNGGIRYRKQGEEAWTYQCVDSGNMNVYKDDGTTRYTAYGLLNNQYPKEQCMESQMVAWHISEHRLPASEEHENVFEVYGQQYYYNEVPAINGVLPKSILDGGMNGRLYRILPTATFTAKDNTGEECVWEMECVQRMSLYGGVKLAGDIYVSMCGGLEVIGTNEHGQEACQTDPVDIYQEPDQMKWHNDSVNLVKDNLGRWDFEDTYHFVGRILSTNNYIKKRFRGAPYVKQGGGSLRTYACGYQYLYNYWCYSASQIGRRARIGARFGGYADSGVCCPRYVASPHSFSYTLRLYGASAQCRVKVSAAPTQSE